MPLAPGRHVSCIFKCRRCTGWEVTPGCPPTVCQSRGAQLPLLLARHPKADPGPKRDEVRLRLQTTRATRTRTRSSGMSWSAFSLLRILWIRDFSGAYAAGRCLLFWTSLRLKSLVASIRCRNLRDVLSAARPRASRALTPRPSARISPPAVRLSVMLQC